MWDAVNLFIVNKIPLFENDIKTWVQRWSYNSNLSLGSGQVNCRNILRKCKQTLEIPEKFEQFITQPDTNNWATLKSLSQWRCKRDRFFFLSSNVCQFKFFLSLRYLNLWCKLLPNYTTEEFLACIPTPSSPQYDVVSYRLF